MASIAGRKINVDSLPEAADYFILAYTKGRGRKVSDLTDAKTGRNVAVVVDYPEPTAFGFDVTSRFYVVFKRNWENHFDRIYDKPEPVGQSLTPDILDTAYLDNFATIALVYIDHTVWTCKADEWLRYASENGTRREVQWEGHEPYTEVSVPRRLLKRVV